MARPGTGSPADLAEDAGAATDRFRRVRLNEGGELDMRGLVASLDGARVLRAQVRGRAEDAEPPGAEDAAAVLEQGAGETLERIYAEAGR